MAPSMPRSFSPIRNCADKSSDSFLWIKNEIHQFYQGIPSQSDVLKVVAGAAQSATMEIPEFRALQFKQARREKAAVLTGDGTKELSQFMRVEKLGTVLFGEQIPSQKTRIQTGKPTNNRIIVGPRIRKHLMNKS